MVKTIIFYLNENMELQDSENLKRLLKELHDKGVAVENASYTSGIVCANLSGCIMICDCEEGAAIARSFGMGYLVYLKDYRAGGCFADSLCIIEGFDEIDYDFLNKMFQRSRHIPWTILETQRCMVREITLDDVDSVYCIYDNPMITKYVEGLYEDREEERDFTKAYIENMYGFYGYGMWVIIEKETKRIIGRAGLGNRDGYKELELGYVIDVAYQQKGYASEVCSAIMKYAMERLGCFNMNAFIRKENIPSIRLAEKLGFRWREEVILDDIVHQRYFWRGTESKVCY